MTYHSFNTHIKRYLLQNFRILSTDQQTRDIFPQTPVVAYKRDLSLRDILVHSTDSSSTEQPGSHACQRPRCHTCEFPTPLTEIQGLKAPSPSAIISPACRKILCTVYPAADAPISTSVKLGEVSGVELVAYATTPLDFLWHNILTPPVTALQKSRYEVCVCVEVPTSSANNWK